MQNCEVLLLKVQIYHFTPFFPIIGYCSSAPMSSYFFLSSPSTPILKQRISMTDKVLYYRVIEFESRYWSLWFSTFFFEEGKPEPMFQIKFYKTLIYKKGQKCSCSGWTIRGQSPRASVPGSPWGSAIEFSGF